MARYFFDVSSHNELLEDDEGFEFPSLQEAKQEAARCAAEMSIDNGPKEIAVHIRDETGDTVAVVRLQLWVEPRGEPS